LADAKTAFEARLQALARANRQLTRSSWSGVDLTDIARLELEPFGDRSTIRGINIILDAQHAQNFTLALHELATNATKYGALPNDRGKVTASWTVTSENHNNRLKFKWQETEGPSVTEPTRQGFGSSLIKGIGRADLRDRRFAAAHRTKRYQYDTFRKSSAGRRLIESHAARAGP